MIKFRRTAVPSVCLSIIPIVFLLAVLIMVIAVYGAESVQDYSYYILLGASAVALVLTKSFISRSWREILEGVRRSARQILPAVPVLFFIGTLSATWMLSGVVPTLIDYGLLMLNPNIFLVLACVICACVSVVTGSSWTTIATIGVALLGIGTVMGYSMAWVAGAIISGAYFGDKVSPLSDTTVLASSTCGVDLFSHIRFLTITTVPAMTIALIVYAIVGFNTQVIDARHTMEMISALNSQFVITPWTLLIPVLTCILIIARLRTEITLAISSLAGLVGIFVFQPQIVATLTDGGKGVWDYIVMSLDVLCTSTSLPTGNDLLDSLVSTGGIAGMLPTIYLVISAMIFGGVMIGSGMLKSITHAITSRINSPRNLVGATVCSGLFFNSCTGDQYLSIIIGGNIYRSTYNDSGVRPEVLSRALEDSVSVTSVLIPWNSCGVTQSTVLGVATLIYLPCCIFNILSPLMSVLIAWLGWRISAPSSPLLAPDEGVRASLD